MGKETRIHKSSVPQDSLFAVSPARTVYHVNSISCKGGGWGWEGGAALLPATPPTARALIDHSSSTRQRSSLGGGVEAGQGHPMSLCSSQPCTTHSNIRVRSHRHSPKGMSSTHSSASNVFNCEVGLWPACIPVLFCRCRHVGQRLYDCLHLCAWLCCFLLWAAHACEASNLAYLLPCLPGASKGCRFFGRGSKNHRLSRTTKKGRGAKPCISRIPHSTENQHHGSCSPNTAVI